MNDLCYKPIVELASLIQGGELSPVELISATFEAIDEREPALNAFITLFRDESLTVAKQASDEIQRGGYRGPLHGVPIALKDLVGVAGTPTTCGSKFFAEKAPQVDATVTAKLKQTGAIIIGKTNLHEFAFGVTTDNPHFGATANPWDNTRVPGGSSGGSGAAVVAGLCAGALGSDTGGSIRIPSSLCGCVGLKPTFGRVSVYGTVELAQSLDTIGPMCRYVGDAALMMNALAGYDPQDVHSVNHPVPDFVAALSQPVAGLKAGLPKQHFFENQYPEVESAVNQAVRALSDLGVEICDVEFSAVKAAHPAALTVLMSEASHFHREQLERHRTDYGADVREILEAGLLLSACDYITAVRAREVAHHELSRLFETVDFLLMPTTPIPAPQRDGSRSNRIRPLLAQNTRSFNLLGLPALSVPCGFTSEGLPIGLQLAGKPWSEATLLRVGYAYEQATAWHMKHPKRPGNI